MDTSTQTLYERARGGDDRALGELLTRYEEPLQAILRRGMGAELRARFETVDLSQSVFREALASAHTLDVRSEEELIGWLARIARNKLRKKARELRAAKRDRGSLLSLGAVTQSGLDIPASGGDPVEDTLRAELRHHLARELRDCDGQGRRLFLLRHRRQLGWKDVAKRLGLSVKAAQKLGYRLDAEISSALERRFRS